MKLDKIFNLLKSHCNGGDIYIVGGLPRDAFLNNIKNIKDIDVTTGDSTCLSIAEKIGKELDLPVKKIRSGAKSIIIDGIKIDFSNNFKYKELENEDSLEAETKSRDFTINGLLISLNKMKCIDLVNGTQDLKNKIIRTPYDPDVCIKYDPKRILRALEFKTRLGFELDDKLKESLVNNVNLLSNVPQRYAGSKINQCLRNNEEEALNLFKEYKILEHCRLTKELKDILLRKKQLLEFI